MVFQPGGEHDENHFPPGNIILTRQGQVAKSGVEPDQNHFTAGEIMSKAPPAVSSSNAGFKVEVIFYMLKFSGLMFLNYRRPFNIYFPFGLEIPA